MYIKVNILFTHARIIDTEYTIYYSSSVVSGNIANIALSRNDWCSPHTICIYTTKMKSKLPTGTGQCEHGRSMYVLRTVLFWRAACLHSNLMSYMYMCM